ncbi:MAG: type I-F CRISPR-associated helicase Cas3, partial [Rhodanobacter sp.]
ADWLGNPYAMHLARLCLMLADHHYSSLGVDKNDQPVAARQRFVQNGQTVFANTLRPAVMNQSLVEHLLGVGYSASLIAHALPNFERHLPRLVNHRGLRKRSADARFAWQDKAFDAASGLRETAREHGAFIINMASTGCGKTLANARILYALADPQLGLRVSYALGLRTLTLQTGRSYRHDLHLNDDELAVLVGGSASRALFEHYEAKAEASGSASVQALIEEDSHVLYEGNVADHPLLSRALANPEIRKLISAPMLVCTVDHLAPATESLRAGRQIAPMLRLMSADLVLDELDDYDLDDLPALTRLMHWAGMLGSRVVLSSATLPPALVEGMFMAYRAGRRHYQHNRGRAGGSGDSPVEVPCLWTDEFGSPQTETLADAADFAAAHARFVERRVGKLRAAPPLRRAELLPIPITARQPERVHAEFANHVRDACLRLHHDHAHADPDTGKHVSFGLVRMANIDPIFDVACALFEGAMPENTRIHLCVYHSRFPLAQRSAIEAMLDATFNRRDPQAVWRQPEIRSALDAKSAEGNHLFVVLASPVCEVGRDWDADWAVAEPSSMRSLIQLAGRVQRHRRAPGEKPNVLVFDSNLKGIQQGDGRQPVFTHPGFESDRDHGRFLLASHSLSVLLTEDEYHHLDAIPRIQPRAAGELRPRERWVDLEQARSRASLLPAALAPATGSARRSSTSVPRLEPDHASPAWQYPQAALTGVLPQQQPFRHDEMPGITLAWLPDEDDELLPHRVEDDRTKRGQKLYVPAPEMLHRIPLKPVGRISPWGEFDLLTLLNEHAAALDRPLDEIARKFTTVDVPRSDQGWRWHPRLGFTRQR